MAKEERNGSSVTVVRSKRVERARAARTGQEVRESETPTAEPLADPASATLVPREESDAGASEAEGTTTKGARKGRKTTAKRGR